MKKNERIAVLEGYRTPMGKMGGSLAQLEADILGSLIVKEIYDRFLDYGKPEDISEVIIGNVAQPAHAANIARVIALRSGLKKEIPAFTVHRNCASGMEAVTNAICKIKAGVADLVLAAGVESMSNIPLLYSKEMKGYLEQMLRCKTIAKKLRHLLRFRLRFLKPIIGLQQGLTDPVCDLIMGLTAENLARDFNISRKEQDLYALASHQKAAQAMAKGIFAEEIIPIALADKNIMFEADEGIRVEQNIKDLTKLRPFFDRKNGTVTAGNSSQITDGAAALLLVPEQKAKAMGVTPIGYIKDFIYTGLEPSRMGLGPAYAIAQILTRQKQTLKDIDLFEINEAFAVQLIACQLALDSKKYCQDKLGLNDKLGLIEDHRLNVNGGAIALGHPVGMTGTRIIIHALRELARSNKQTAIASLCIGGGQGAAILLEAK
ncbi:MAG: thiolase family protein [Rickettsiales bacterium]